MVGDLPRRVAQLATPFWAQASMPSTSTSSRTGTEPFFLLNAIWVSGSSSTLGQLDLGLMRAGSSSSGTRTRRRP